MQQHHEPISLDQAREKKVIILAGSSTMAMVLGVSSIIPLLPMLAERLEVSLPTVSFLITAFTLPGIIFTPLAGLFIDRYGRRAVLIPSLLLFGLAGSACALAPDFPTTVALRFLQGVGAAPLGILNTTLIGDTFQGNRLSKMIGYNMTLLNMCTALYPAIGGFLAHINWRLPFFLPLMALPVILVALRTPMPFTPQPTTLKSYLRKMGTALSTPVIFGMLTITLLTFIMLYGPIITSFPILAHKKFLAKPATIGSIMMLFSIGSGLMASQSGRLANSFAPRTLLFSSLLLYTLGLLLIPFMSSLWLLLPCLLIYGMGQGINIPNIQTTLIQSVHATERASVLAMNGMLLRIGQTLSPVIFSSLAAWYGPEAPYRFALLLPIFMAILAFYLIAGATRSHN